MFIGKFVSALRALTKLTTELKGEKKMSIQHYKGTQEEFEKIQDNKTFYKVEGLYIDENNNLFYVIGEEPIKILNQIDFIKKI